MYIHLLYCFLFRFLLDLYLNNRDPDSIVFINKDNVLIASRPETHEILGVLINRERTVEIISMDHAFRSALSLLQTRVGEEVKLPPEVVIKLITNSLAAQPFILRREWID